MAETVFPSGFRNRSQAEQSPVKGSPARQSDVADGDDDALQVAQRALETADEALVTAQEAAAAAEWANINAQSALNTVDHAQNAADLAVDAATTAQQRADEAHALAAGAVSAAVTAQARAEAAYELVLSCVRLADVGVTESLAVGEKSPAALRVRPAGGLTVTLFAPGSSREKRTTLIIAPLAPVTITWNVPDSALAWVGPDAATEVGSGRVAVVSVWQAGGLTLLSLVHQGQNPDALFLTFDTRLQAGVTLSGLNRTTTTDDIGIDWGDGTVWTHADLPATGDTVYTYTGQGEFQATLYASRADCRLAGNPALTAAHGMLPRGFSPGTGGQEVFADCANLAVISGCLFAKQEDVVSFSRCFQGCASLTALPDNLFARAAAATDFTSCFAGCASLVSVSGRLFHAAAGAVSFRQTFDQCAALREIPADLFKNAGQAESFYYTFRDCVNLQAIPAGLFDGATEATSFFGCFLGCLTVTAIPPGLFDHTPKVTRFKGCFYRCPALEAIPAGLFDHTPQVEDFANCFRDCSGLTAIPEGLFDASPAVRIFAHCFYQCTAITSRLPELWTRPNVISFEQCYGGCSGAANYADIPAAWR